MYAHALQVAKATYGRHQKKKPTKEQRPSNKNECLFRIRNQRQIDEHVAKRKAYLNDNKENAIAGNSLVGESLPKTHIFNLHMNEYIYFSFQNGKVSISISESCGGGYMETAICHFVWSRTIIL